ncbi:methyltransferase domain-containing protein [Aquihabitans sp. G128]|uniref:class I SAM-dependent methyltransferase n=1 Tax=Aquihabitans sp. G128 TaxID=2849779 RepID=UPI001C24BB09|nr:methyltransferase domain-containing protein [Aquihabitans sp. G128]QXC61704.1 methyltransferase domain-containing protein [Aquihabitans sp. G128]
MSYADRYDPDEDFDRWYTTATAREVVRWLRPGDPVLELGCATGLMTASLAGAGAVVTAVDHAPSYLERLRARDLPDVVAVEHDIVTIDLGARFRHVVLANVAHEVADPAALFRTAAAHLVPGGLLHVTLQNPRSIHRLVGLELGVIGDLQELSDRGKDLDTVQLLDADRLAALGRAAGLRGVHRGGIMLKPLPNDLMAALPEAVLEGFVAAAHHLPEHASMSYLVLERPTGADGG